MGGAPSLKTKNAFSILDFQHQGRKRPASATARRGLCEEAAAGRLAPASEGLNKDSDHDRPYLSATQECDVRQARVDEWVLNSNNPSAPRRSTDGVDGQRRHAGWVRLKFPQRTRRGYAKAYVPARVHATPPKSLKLQAYADNFR